MENNSLLKGVTVSRLLGPVDANIHGNVHGGVLLNLIEEAGAILTTRYCNNAPGNTIQDACSTVLARIENMDFKLPMHIGEVAEVSAEILFTSHRSLEVQVTLLAEDIVKGGTRLISQARLWYVPLCMDVTTRIPEVPAMTYTSQQAEARGQLAYEKQRADRMRKASEPCLTALLARSLNLHADGESPPLSVAHSRSVLSFVVGVEHVTPLGFCRGGVLLKVMDQCAGIVASKHTRGACVTACVDAINFHKKINRGQLVTVVGQATFTSSRSIEIEVIVEIEGLTRTRDDETQRERAVDSFFTYVTIDKDGKALALPQLLRRDVEEEKRFLSGEHRYQQRKQLRKAAKECEQSPDRVRDTKM